MADSVPTASEIEPSTIQQPPEPIGPLRRFSTAFRSLKHRNYRLFFFGQIISLVGTWMQTIAQTWLIYRMTGSAALLGLLGFVSQIPIFLLSPIAGLVVDRWPRRAVVVATQNASMLLAFILAVLTLTGRIRIWEIIVLATLLGVVNALDVPARQSFVIEMVGREDLLNAIALNSSMFNGARLAGPAVAGLLVAWIGEGWCFLANGLSYLAVIAGLLMMRLKNSVQVHDGSSPAEKLLEGFRFARHTLPIRALLLLVALVSFMALPYTVLLPIFADRMFHGGASVYGVLMGAIGVGALTGALVLAMRQQLKGLGNIVAYSAIGLGIAILLFSASRWYWLSLAALAMSGLGMMMQFGSTNTLIQSMVPDRLRGRVMALYSMMFLGMAPLGSLLSGALADRIGVRLTVALGGVASLIGGIVFAQKWPAMRAPARELIAAEGLDRSMPRPDASARSSS